MGSLLCCMIVFKYSAIDLALWVRLVCLPPLISPSLNKIYFLLSQTDCQKIAHLCDDSLCLQEFLLVPRHQYSNYTGKRNTIKVVFTTAFSGGGDCVQ